MWPYNDDEAAWLTPPHRAEQPVSANDNDPRHRVPSRPKSASPPARKTERET